MARWIVPIALVAIFLVVGGYLLAVLVPQDADEPAGQPTTVIKTTLTIPPYDP